ncbi:MAG: glucokinase [Cyanophyceae cyanobacterium]
MTWLLAGDIGGTKTILRLAHQDPMGSVTSLWEKRYSSSSYSSLIPIVRTFLQEIPTEVRAQCPDDPQPHRACFAIAGPVVKETAQVTNLPWQLNSRELAQALDLKQAHLINDFSAVGYGLLHLDPQDLHTLHPGSRDPHSPIAVIGAGTGLGQGYLTWNGDRYQVYASEGGHTDFAARTPLEFELLGYLRQRIGGRVSVERVVSGMGIASIYQFLLDSGRGAGADAEIVAALEKNGDQDPGALISMAAQALRDPVAEQTMELFLSCYGGEVGNLALKLLPSGGIYIAGGIAAKNISLLEQGGFIAAYLNKGRMRPLLETFSIQVILNPQVGLIGAMAFAAQGG